MKSLKIDDSNFFTKVQEERITDSELAKFQWALIGDLALRYHGKTIYGTTCKFEDDNWYNIDSSSTGSRTGINWLLLAASSPALRVLVKAMMFETIFDRSMELSTAAGRFHSLRGGIISLIESKKLLTGNNGDTILGLSHLNDHDLLVMLDAQLVAAASEEKFRTKCYELDSFHAYANHVAEQVPVYQIRASLPWQKSGETVANWARKRAADLKVIFPTVEGYEPLPSETVQPLVEKSLTLIEEHFDHFVEIAPLVAAYVDATSFDETYALGILKQYGPIFGYIHAPPKLSGRTTDKRVKVAAVFSWLRELLYLARGACANVILLTTGLRNSDVRTLQIGECRPSGRIDMLFYLRADISKTKNIVVLPVPGQTEKACRLLEKIKFANSSFLIDSSLWPASEESKEGKKSGGKSKDSARLNYGDQLNFIIRDFAIHFNIPFQNPKTGKYYTAHCYRTTVAGWLGSASNLSLLLVRRLFGHSNDVMPTVYLNNNPAFLSEREAQKKRANTETARQMALAASKGRVAGMKGEQLVRGFQEHKSHMESNKQKSHSLTDAEILISFAEILEQRITSGSACGFLTPFGVQCMRNPSDTSQPPCAKRANRDKTQGIAPELLRYVSDINPQQCIGTSCSEAMLGPWSTSVLETLNWYRALMRHQLGNAFNEAHFIESAAQFIRQYEAPLKKVFGITTLQTDPILVSNEDKDGLVNG
ncbi:MAG: hypothetical protein WCT35_09755 [Sideroxydans sp.]